MNTSKFLTINNFNRMICIHILCWLLFITYELITVYFVVGKLEDPTVYIIYYPINIGFFYLYIFLLNFTFNGLSVKIFKGLIGYLVLIGVFLIVKSAADYFLTNYKSSIHNKLIYIESFLPRNLFRAVYFTVLGTFYWSAAHISFYREKKSEAERSRLFVENLNIELENKLTRAQNAYLQQQINPHLLFNALNFVYSTTQRYSDDAANCVWLLSEIMRYSLEGADTDGKVSLSQELEQVENLLTINRYRFQQPLNFSIDVEGNFRNYRIIPLILLTLIENIFKHGNLLVKENPAKILIVIDERGILTYQSINLKKSKNPHQCSQQIGLKNTLIRLESSYAGNYSLNIAEPEELYILTLNLNL